MNTLRSYLCAGVGFLVLVNVIVLTSAVRGGSQGSMSISSVRTPFQKTVTFDGSNATTLSQFTPQEVSFTVPRNRLLVIQQVTAMGGSEVISPDGSVFKLTTIAGGNSATYALPNCEISGSFINGVRTSLVSIYADPGSKVTITGGAVPYNGRPRQLQLVAKSIVISGYLTKSL